jgi:hypothetical protein
MKKSFIIGAILSGIIAILYDKILRQIIFEQTIEKGYISEECKQYRRTFPHYITIFFMGVTIYVIGQLLHF